MGGKPGRRQQQGEETRQRILDATIEIAAERGYEGTSMSQIAERAGVSMSSIYWHFADKDAVIAAVLERSHHRWFGEQATYRPPAAGQDVRDYLITAVRDDLVALTKHPEFLRLGLMLSLERRPSEPTARAFYHEKRRESIERLEQTFVRLLADVPARDDVRHRLAGELALLVIALADGIFIAHQIAPDQIDLESVIDLFIGGVLDRAFDRLDASNASEVDR